VAGFLDSDLNCTATDAIGDGCPATSAYLKAPVGVAVDSSGNLFIGDSGNNVVREVNATTHIIATFAGTGAAGNGADNQAPGSTALSGPSWLALQGLKLYIVDAGNNVVRVVNLGAASPVMNIVAGGGSGSCSGQETDAIGDGCPPTNAKLNTPTGIALDAWGNLYVVDNGDNAVREVNAAGSMITRVAGNGTPGYTGDRAPAIAAELNSPYGVVVDNFGNLYVADNANNVIREVQPATVDFGRNKTGQISPTFTIVFSFSTGSTVGGAGVLTLGASGKDFQRLASDSITSGTCPVSSSAAYKSGDSCMVNVTFDPQAPGVRNGAVVLYDTSTPPNTLARLPIYGTGIAPAIAFAPGTISTVAGTGGTCPNSTQLCGDGGKAVNAQFHWPTATAVDGYGNLYIADEADNRVRRVDAVTGLITTYAGNGTMGYNGDNILATAAELAYPDGLAVDGAGNLYIADNQSNRVRKVDAASGIITTVATVNAPESVVADRAGNLYVSIVPAQGANPDIFKVDAVTGGVSSILGLPYAWSPVGLALDGAGSLYIGDWHYNTILQLNLQTFVVTTVAGGGTGTCGGTETDSLGDGCPATSALINPRGIAVDSAGNLYIADFSNQRIRVVNASTHIITTVAGDGTACANPTNICGDGGAANNAQLNFPWGVSVDSAGNLYVSDQDDMRVRKVDVADAPTLAFTANVGSPSAEQKVSVENLGNAQLSIASIAPDQSFPFVTADTTCSLTSETLDPAASCILALNFTPQTVDSFTGSVVLTDNALNATAATQTLKLNGTGTAVPTTTTVTSPENVYSYGSSITLTAVVTSGTPTGTVTFYDGSTQLDQPRTLDGSGKAVLTTSALTAGYHSIYGNYSGDSTYAASSGSTYEEINAATLTITAKAQSKSYGQALTLGSIAFTANGLTNGDKVTSVTLTSAGAAATATVSGSPYAIVPSAAVGTGLGNYAIGYANGKLTVKPAALTITAGAQSKSYGKALTLGSTDFTASGLTNGDKVTSVTLTSAGAAATATVSGSPYAIVPSAAAGTGLGNYAISYANGKLTVKPATLTVAAGNKVKKQGTANPALTYKMSGFVNGDKQTTVTSGQPTLTTSAKANSPVGTYPITITAGTGTGALTLKTTNYQFKFVNGTLTVK
jgi:sugar lactone lactonase YvrE/plastocyanin